MLVILLVFYVAGFAQEYQTKIDTMWCGMHYQYVNDVYSKTSQQKTGTINVPKTTGIKFSYYWRMPAGNTTATLTFKPAYARKPVMTIKLTRVSTGDVIYEGTITNTNINGQETNVLAIPNINIPTDEYYKADITFDNPSYVQYLKYFLFQRTSNLAILQHALGGYGSHLFSWQSTDPNAPKGQAYDWAYQEVMVPFEYEHPADYYEAIATLSCYMGIQSLGRTADGDFKRAALFSAWDTGNTDEDPDLPQYLRAKVYDYNHNAVSGHGGGEGSSGTVNFRDSPSLWSPNHWIQFIINCRPENSVAVYNDASGKEVTKNVENTLLSVWYKIDTAKAWTYMGTIREAAKNELMQTWYSFIENFGGAEGDVVHRVYYRHGYLRSAASGKWYNCNKVGYSHYSDRNDRTDRGHGATRLYENAFYMDYGAFLPPNDSANITGVPVTDECVDTISIDRFNARIDSSVHKWRIFEANTQINKFASNYKTLYWKLISSTGTGAANLTSTSKSTYWESKVSEPGRNELVYKATAGIPMTVTSLGIHFPDGYSTRCRYMDVYTSEDGENWSLGADSVCIYTEDDNDITLPKSLKATYFKFQFYDYIDKPSCRLKISYLAIRGEYDLQKMLDYVADIIKNENTLEYYKSEDLVELKKVYDEGKCTDSNALADAVKGVIVNSRPMQCGRIAQAQYIVTTKAYMLRNETGQGFLCATPDGKLILKGATVEGVDATNQSIPVASDPYNNWNVLMNDKYSGACIYNVGCKKYLNPDAENMLSDEPYKFVLTISKNGFAFRTYEKESVNYNKFLNLDATKTDGSVFFDTKSNSCLNLLDNYCMRPANAEVLKVGAKSFLKDRLETYKQRAKDLLELPNNVVGAFADEADRELVEKLYNGGEVSIEDAEEFIETIDSAEYIVTDSKHAYRFKTTCEDAASTPYLTISSTSIDHKSSTNQPDQIWTFVETSHGKTLTAQGYGINCLPTDNSGNGVSRAIGVRPFEMAFTYYLTEEAPGKYYLSDAYNPEYVVHGSANPITSKAKTIAGASWMIEQYNQYSLTLNKAGVEGLCVDFDLLIPEGVEVYTGYSVSNDGVIKLCKYNEKILPASTPVLIKGEKSEKIVFEIVGHEVSPFTADNLFGGCLFKNTTLKKKQYYTLKLDSNNNPIMKQAAMSSLAGANDIYVELIGDRPNLAQYTFDFENIIEGVKTSTIKSKRKKSVTYDVLGRSTKSGDFGFYISSDGLKYIK